MGNVSAVGPDTKVTKDQAMSAVMEAFRGKQFGDQMSIKDIAAALSLQACEPEVEEPAKDAVNPLYRTSYQMMTDRKPLKSSATLAGSAGMVIGGHTPRAKGGPLISWNATISSGSLTRDMRMVKVRNMFEALGNDHSRDVTQEEFVAALATEEVDTKEAIALFREIDESRTGRLTMAKFDHYVAVLALSIVRDTFKRLDASKDRQVQKEEFVRYFLGNGLSKDQVMSLWQAIDPNGNGKVCFQEYRDWAKEALTTSSLDDISASLGLSAGRF
ncbi:unnamed protein product [Polarella glacialis]|uniref:EF-hand domain-containing protein n=1 Tax=Polarella glacialis TaxID=89957 RepID=A0A813D4X2_POLGL|nr:unnamed protein product [Polarella glacialis]|mmetsp:Transcript_60781/g.109500  ORF Transcript_60781/g.109500 Transcript_60781/m.109500 type:complete len:273 (-) Transcript_60781:212-1030(-)